MIMLFVIASQSTMSFLSLFFHFLVSMPTGIFTRYLIYMSKTEIVKLREYLSIQCLKNARGIPGLLTNQKRSHGLRIYIKLPLNNLKYHLIVMVIVV